jgi:uncharacterized protein (DUF58 family)
VLPVPTRRLAVVAALGALAVVAADSVAAFWVLNALLVAVAVADWALTPPVGRVEVRREVPEAVPLGGRITLTWRVRNTSDRALSVVVADELAPSLRPSRRRFEARIPARSTVTATAELRPVRRGRFDPHRVTVRVHGPLGLAARQGTVVVPGRLRVLPSFSSRDEAELRIDRARILEVGLRSAKGRGGGTEFDQLREYTPDDEFRKIDWAATARAGKAIVRSYRAERNQTVVNLLDNGRVMAARVGGVPRVEHAMDAVMMLTYVATRLGDRAGLIAFDRQVRAVVEPGHGAAQLGRVTDALYDLAPALAASDYQGAFAATLARFRRRALLVIHTDLVEQAVGESLLPALPVISRSHLVIVAAVQDPDVAAWAVARPADGEEAFRQAAASAALEERRRATAALRRLGVTVVDAPPGELAAQLADAYLRVKATGRL